MHPVDLTGKVALMSSFGIGMTLISGGGYVVH